MMESMDPATLGSSFMGIPGRSLLRADSRLQYTSVVHQPINSNKNSDYFSDSTSQRTIADSDLNEPLIGGPFGPIPSKSFHKTHTAKPKTHKSSKPKAPLPHSPNEDSDNDDEAGDQMYLGQDGVLYSTEPAPTGATREESESPYPEDGYQD